jgi:hypothetical protein
MKKYIVALALLALASFQVQAKNGDCSGFGNDCQGQAQGQLQGQGQMQGNINDISNDSNARSTAISGAHSDSDSESNSRSGALAGAATGAVSMTVRTKYDSVASSAAELNLAYCSDGVSGQVESFGFSSGQVNFICESVMALNVVMTWAESELATADALEPIDKNLADSHIIKAQQHILEGEGIMQKVVDYIDGRSNTAGIGAAGRDLSVPLGIIGLLFFLL